MKPDIPPELFSLLVYLEEEFQAYPQVRVQLRQTAVLRRSPDLVQDYDPESNDLHRTRGVLVKAGSREYFFPVSANAHSTSRSTIDEMVREIRESLI